MNFETLMKMCIEMEHKGMEAKEFIKEERGAENEAIKNKEKREGRVVIKKSCRKKI